MPTELVTGGIEPHIHVHVHLCMVKHQICFSVLLKRLHLQEMYLKIFLILMHWIWMMFWNFWSPLKILWMRSGNRRIISHILRPAWNIFWMSWLALWVVMSNESLACLTSGTTHSSKWRMQCARALLYVRDGCQLAARRLPRSTGKGSCLIHGRERNLFLKTCHNLLQG